MTKKTPLPEPSRVERTRTVEITASDIFDAYAHHMELVFAELVSITVLSLQPIRVSITYKINVFEEGQYEAWINSLS